MSTERAAPSATEAVEERERDFWDHHVPTLAELRVLVHSEPDLNTKAMLDAVAPGPGVRVLDFACGAGLTTAWLASAGAEVVGVDVSPVSIRRAEELRTELGLDYELRVVGLDARPANPGETFDAMVGRFALHHLDLSVYAPLLASTLRPGGVAAFLETMATNPVLRFARAHVVGRFGIPRWGTVDEHPLTRADLAFLGATFGSLEVSVPDLRMFRLVDRHLLHRRKPRITRMLDAIDHGLHRFRSLDFLSYQQLLVLRATRAVPPPALQ